MGIRFLEVNKKDRQEKENHKRCAMSGARARACVFLCMCDDTRNLRLSIGSLDSSDDAALQAPPALVK